MILLISFLFFFLQHISLSSLFFSLFICEFKIVFSSFIFSYLSFFNLILAFSICLSIIKLYSFLSILIKGGAFVSSKEEERSLIIERFKKGYYSYLVTTSILERGVTVENLQVIVFSADNEIYDSASLIQIAGRAGRKINSPYGKVIFIGEEFNSEIEKCISEISKYNKVKNNESIL